MDLYESLSHPDTMTLQEMLDSDIKVEFDDSDIKVEFDSVLDHPDLADLGHGIDFGKELAKLEEAQTLDAHLDSDMDDLHNTWLNSSSSYNNMDFEATGLMVNPSTVVPTTLSCPVSFGAFQNISLVSSSSSVTSIINGIELAKGKKLEQCTVASALSELPSVKVPSILPSSGIQVHYAKTVPRNQENASGNVTVNINDLQNAPQRSKKSHASAVLSEGQKPFPKPAYSYSCLIAMALKNSNTGSLPVSEIYNFMCEHFPYFKTAPNGWKNSVRHNLSLNKCFEKIEKPASNGSQKKGCLWAMNPDKITKMDEEVLKWSRKDPLAIKQAMAHPDNLEYLERGEMKINYKPRHESGSCSLDSEEEEFDSGSLESIHHEIKIDNDDEPGIEKVTIDNAQLLNGSSSTTLEFVDIQGNSAIIEALSAEQLSALQSLTAQGGEVITTISSADVSNLLQNNHVLTTGLIPTTLLLQNNNDELKAYVKSELKHPVSA